MHKSDNRRFAKHLGLAIDLFERPAVTIELPPGQENRPEAIAAFMLAANLLCRLFSNVFLVAPDTALGPNPWGLTRLAELQPILSALSQGQVLWRKPGRSHIVLAIGAPPTLEAARASHITFNGWVFGLDREVGTSHAGIFGALFAACYGAAQTFLHAAILAGADYRLIKPFRLSLLSYDHADTNAPMPKDIDFGDSHLVGVGAVGCAFVYSVAHLPSSEGLLHLIDNDYVEASNLERYALMQKTDLTCKKTDVAQLALHYGGPRGVSHPVSFKQYQAQHGYAQDLLITPVDSEAGRRKLATCLPRAVLNAATNNTSVTVSRHGFANSKACLHCLYLPQLEEITTEKRIAIDMGLSVEQVEAHLFANEPITEELVRSVEKHLCIECGKFQDWVGKHIQSFYQRAICSEAQINTPTGTIVSPLSFISSIAGVLLAIEFVKYRAPELSKFTLNNFFRLDTLFAPNIAFRHIKPQDSSRRCICWDEDYISAYRRKYGTGRTGRT